MPLRMDPAGNEIRALEHVVGWKGMRVLEIGCGDGRLTRRLAAFGPAAIEAIDPDEARIRQARRGGPDPRGVRIAFHVGKAEKLRYPNAQFDLVVLAWSL